MKIKLFAREIIAKLSQNSLNGFRIFFQPRSRIEPRQKLVFRAAEVQGKETLPIYSDKQFSQRTSHFAPLDQRRLFIKPVAEMFPRMRERFFGWPAHHRAQ